MLWVFESHPVQYRVPVYRELQRLRPGRFRVLYACDVSARACLDPGFGVEVRWDIPLLEGYPNEVLHQQRGTPLQGWRSLHGRGIARRVSEGRPSHALLTSFAYAFDWAALFSCRKLGIPVWMRQETQDVAFRRGRGKAFLRSIAYRALYLQVAHAFYIGELNRQHLRRHGIPEERLSRCPYCVPNPLSHLSSAEKARLAAEARQKLGIFPSVFVVGFCGKLIPKKDPELLLRAAASACSRLGRPAEVLIVGSGELELRLRALATEMGLRVHFVGFVNQRELPPYYLAMDILVLPSRRMGETWGLVVNEALHAGCGVAVSDAVGCSAEFGLWERVRVFPAEDTEACARSILELASMHRSWDWAERGMEGYSVGAAAAALAARMT